jgi:hypothetical protein
MYFCLFVHKHGYRAGGLPAKEIMSGSELRFVLAL